MKHRLCHLCGTPGITNYNLFSENWLHRTDQLVDDTCELWDKDELDALREIYSRKEIPDHTAVYCFPCLCRESDICVGCLEPTEVLVPEPRCSAHPWVCQPCLADDKITHLHVCESSGCMTPEEFARDAQIMIDCGEL